MWNKMRRQYSQNQKLRNNFRQNQLMNYTFSNSCRNWNNPCINENRGGVRPQQRKLYHQCQTSQISSRKSFAYPNQKWEQRNRAGWACGTANFDNFIPKSSSSHFQRASSSIDKRRHLHDSKNINYFQRDCEELALLNSINEQKDRRSPDDLNNGYFDKRKTLFMPERISELESIIWPKDESGSDDDKNADECQIFKFTNQTLPEYDGKTLVGNEGIYEIKVLRCTFCNMLMMNKEKCRAHMLTKYHYNNYKKSLVDYENEKKEQSLASFNKEQEN